MAKPDGRIEKGQRLSTAISARAWNRAQDAADVVLGVRPGVEAAAGRPLSYCVSAVVRLDPSPSISYSTIGIPIKLTGAQIQGVSTAPVGLEFVIGQIATPADLRGSTQLPAPEAFAVTLEPITAGSSALVRCAIAGLCVARVRVFQSSDKYVALPTRRADAETVAELTGTLESSTAGAGRLIAVLSEDFSLILI